MAPNKSKSIVNISLFVSSPVPPLRFVPAPKQTLYVEKASQPAEDTCTSSQFLPRSNRKHFHSCPFESLEVKVNSQVFGTRSSSNLTRSRSSQAHSSTAMLAQRGVQINQTCTVYNNIDEASSKLHLKNSLLGNVCNELLYCIYSRTSTDKRIMTIVFQGKTLLLTADL